MPPAPTPTPTPPSRGGGRRLGFRLLALALPFLILAGAEGVLRLRGRRTPTAFWVPTGQAREWMPNPRFAERFVGKVLARMPRSVRVQVPPPQEALRVVVFGESAALGDPEPTLGASRCLAALLEARFPDRRVEVVNTAVTALNSHALRAAARDSRRLGADVWVVYAGNNEVIGPFGPASMDAGRMPGLTTLRAGLLFRETALGQWLTDRPTASGEGLSMTQRWAGLEMFLDRQVPAQDPRLPSMRDVFSDNISDVVRLGIDSGAKVLLSTMAVNLTDCPPFGSASRMDTNRAGYAAWAAVAKEARSQDDLGALPAAIAGWRKAVALWPEDAEGHYQLGQALLNAGEYAAGRAELEQARDLDTLRLRADSGINQRVRDLASGFPTNRVRLVDADRLLRGADPDRPPGADLFFEHVHLRPEGNYRLARLWAEQIAAWLPAPSGGATNGGAGRWLELQPCLERLGWTPYAEARLWGQIRALCERPPFSQQSHAELRNRFLEDRLADANRSARPSGLSNAVQRLRAVADAHPADGHVREQLARLLQQGRRWAEAAKEWRQVTELSPAHVVAWFQLGETLASADDGPGALAAYDRALALRPDFVEASLGVGLVLGNSGKLEAAIAALDRALQLSPRSLQARVNRGVSLVGLGRTQEGLSDLRRAAEEHPTATVPLERIGEVLSNQKEHVKAVEAYVEAARRDRRNPALQQRLAIEMSRAGQSAEAEAVFRALIAAYPNAASVRLDLGVALAQRSRFAEAIPEFEAVLKLQPNNAQAQAYLKQAQTQLQARPQPSGAAPSTPKP